MLDNPKQIDLLLEYDSVQEMLDNALIVTRNLFMNDLSNLEIKNYQYTPDKAIEELGLDSVLINQLVEDYVNQIIKSKDSFIKHIEKLQYDKKNAKELDYKDLRELAHKNLGVARNLRIEDAQKLLYKIMKVDDLEYISKCLEALIASAIILKPKFAYEILISSRTNKSL